MESTEQFSANLRAARLEAGLSQEDLSSSSGLHSTEVSRLERGTREPRLSTLVKLAKGLGVDVAVLVRGVK